MKNRHFLSAALVAALWLGLTALAWFGPRHDISDAERRKLEQFPSASAQNIGSGLFMSKFEAFSQDQFPLRDGFRQLKSLFSYNILRQSDNHGIYIVDGQAAKLEYPLNDTSVKNAAAKFQNIYDLYLKDNAGSIVFSVVPDKGFYLAEKNGIPAMDYDRLFATMEQQEWARYADISGSLSAADYYRTDTHWRQEKLFPAARVLADALGVTAPNPEDFWQEQVDRPFYGVYYGQAALPLDADTMVLMESNLLGECTVTNLDSNSISPVYNPEKLESRDLYDVFLSGSVSVLEIDNPAGIPGRELVVFRDSFGSSMIPLLVGDYAKITAVDIRYVPTSYVGNFVDFHGQDVLFLYSTTVLNNSAMLK